MKADPMNIKQKALMILQAALPAVRVVSASFKLMTVLEENVRKTFDYGLWSGTEQLMRINNWASM